MKYYICAVPAAAVRKKASHKTEMINQLLFGETMELMKKKKGWFKIRSLPDHYEGWVRSNQVEQIKEKDIQDNSWVAADLFNTVIIEETKMCIPIGSSLPSYEEQGGFIANKIYRFAGHCFARNTIKPDEHFIQRLTHPWLNAPYLWGGRTPLGVDCSGFVQLIFKMIGIDLNRDARQQAKQGIEVKDLNDVKCGDLAFFNDDEEIVHVGILLNKSVIIHASGKIRIDNIDKKGIKNTDTGKRTHRLKTIRRFW